MKKLKMTATILLASVIGATAQNWGIDASHSKIEFGVTHMLISEVSGQFKIYEGKAITTNDDFNDSKIEFSADVKSIDTDNEKRDNHLQSDDFFNAEKYPKITFKSKSFKKVSGNNYKLIGELTIRDVTKTIELDVTYNGTIKDPYGNSRAGFKLRGSINRFDFGLKWNKALEAGGAVVGEIVTISCNVELIKQK